MRAASAPMNDAAAKRSGEHRTMRARPERIRSRESRTAASSMPEAIIAAGWPPSTSRRYWSAISAISGDTITVSSGEAIPGSW